MAATTERTSIPSRSHGAALGHLALGALGIVFGDIGTSPLYTLRECTSAEHGVPPTPENVLGLLSLVFWALTMVVSVKYLGFVMRADNDGEGGIFALLALLPKGARGERAGPFGWVAVLVIIGAALIFGDGMITPAISVLSAIEGLEVAAPGLRPLVIPVTCLVLLGLFAVQHVGTGGIGRLFGPVMVVWFSVLAGLGAWHLVRHPAVLGAISPHHALRFFAEHRFRGFLVLGSVVLAITGGEALYADMGHFGRRPIRLAWFSFVMPALLLDYFGQGALLIADPDARRHPFFAMVPAGWPTYALVVLASVTTVIASQALISGAFSLTHQAVQLGFFPRVTVKHTSRATEGQIYIPEINWGLAVACIVLVVVFRASTNLAAAYGIAVTGTMAITSVTFFEVARARWHWPLWRALPLLIVFLSFDLSFFASALFKFADGGYVPIFVGAVLFVVMMTWSYGRHVYGEYLASIAQPLDEFVAKLDDAELRRIPGAGIFLTADPEGVPRVVRNMAARMRCLPQTVVIVTVTILHVPHVQETDPVIEDLGSGFCRAILTFGFMDASDVPRALRRASARLGLSVDLDDVTYYAARDTFVGSPSGRMGRLSEGLFAFLYRNAKSATYQFCIPPTRVVEIGTQIDL